jgi:ADP-ribose pyrophosphatase YjhB (NUDIX family)
MDLGESLVDTAVREVKEETGIDCEITGLVGIYTDPKHVILYTSDGEAQQEFSVLFTAPRRRGRADPQQREPPGGVGRPEPAAGPADGRLDAAAGRALPAGADQPLPRLTGMADPAWIDVGANVFSAVGMVGAFAIGMVLLRQEHKREELRNGGKAEFIALVPPGQTIQRPAPRGWLKTYHAPEPVQLEFLDSSGRHWTRSEQGALLARA